uniref:Large ribosomal subunit protein eL28 n=1 Tax=Argas monolakensis TaxID=34602 RepID=Q09JQ7_ARGMO|nr:60S ribosomal protein L28 [Argas monolakensis]
MVSRTYRWMVVRNCSSFLVKKRNIKKWFSTDPLNPKGVYANRFAGTIKKRALTVEPHSSGKGVTFVYLAHKGATKPAKRLKRVQLVKGPRRTMVSIRNWIKGMGYYRRDLRRVCQRRASAILKSQRAIVPKKKTARGAKKAD